MSMRTWNDRLFLDAMPGRKKMGRPQGDFAQWEREMKEHAIGTVVCLAPNEQIADESPEYAAWLTRHEGSHSATTAVATASRVATDVQIIRLPIDDFSIPVPFQVPVFWKRAKEVAASISTGERVFVHCGAGIGRTGMFAVAVLMKLGYSYDDAYAEIRAVGSYPETPEQREFIRNND
jgi:protein-tyrosine phosphatase